MGHPRLLAFRRLLALAVLLLLLLPLSASAWPVTAPPARQELHLLAGRFDPLLDPVPAGFAVARGVPAGPYIVQFRYPMGGWEAAATAAAGGTVAAYLPDGAFVVVGGPAFPAAARALQGVRWVGALPASARLAPGALAADVLQVRFAGAADALLPGLHARGLHALALGAGTAVLSGPAGAAAAAATSFDSVLWVEPYRPPVPLNYQAVLTGGLRAASNNSSYSESAGALWVFDPGSASFVGYTGTGFRVDVTDQGVDGTHPAFAGRTTAYRSWTGGGDWTDAVGHGTHVAGSALGSGAYLAADASLPTGYFAGAAPGAGLVGQRYNASALNYSGMAEFASASGAVASVNSWGDAGAATWSNYTAAAAAYDALTADAGTAPGLQPLLFVFAVGNENQAPGSVLPPGTAKNVLTVGGTGNDYAGGTASSQVAPFSSFGPTDDGRVKPDLVAPGERVASANATQDAASGILPRPALGGSSYVYLSGTSQAAPQVAGASAVAAQFLRDTRGIDATPALLKAALINGAAPLPGYLWPGPAQGWGRLDLRGALLDAPGHTVEFVREGRHTFTSTIDVYQHNIELDAGSDLRVTLVWTDAAGSPVASKALVNDLDLEVRDPSDALIFSGNAINQSTAYSVAGAGGDHTNNVEVVRVAGASAGVWKVVVRPYNLPTGAQSFALAMSGAINATGRAMSVTPESASVEVAPGGSATLNVTLANLGDSAENVSLTAEPRWVGGEAWQATNATVALAPLEQRTVQLVLTNNDTGPAGTRGQLALRATVESTGFSFSAEVAVRLAAAPCLDARVDSATAESGVVLRGAEAAAFLVELDNCGNTELAVGLRVEGPAGYAPLDLDPPIVHAPPGQAVSVPATLRAPAAMPDLDAAVTLVADAASNTTEVGLWIHRRTGVVLNASGLPASVDLHGTEATFTITLLNEGTGGAVLAPEVRSLNGWEATVSPATATVGAGASASFEVTARRPSDGPAQDQFVIVLYPGLQGGPTASLDALWAPALRPPTPPWPTDASAAIALLAGLSGAAIAAALTGRSRGLPARCPACGRKAPRFDTFLNPSCAGCGAVLAPKGGGR